MINKIDNFFKVTKRNSTIKREVVGGFTAYFAMCYIIFVNPIILSQAGMNSEAVFVATIIASGVSTIFMGLYANVPLGLAPCMSMNAFFTFTVVGSSGYSWQVALSAVFLSGIIFFLLSISKIRIKIIDSIPDVLKSSATVGLGLFIAFIGLKNSQIIVASQDQLITFGKLTNPNVIIGWFGIIVASIMLVKKSNFAVLWGMISAAILGLILHFLATYGVINYSTEVINTLPVLPETLFSNPFNLIKSMEDNTLFVALYNIPQLISISGITLVFSFVFLDFFGTATTLEAAKTQIPGEKGEKVYLADSIGTIIGSLLGTSNVTTYIESVSGVVSGARTGLMAVVVGILFFLSIFLYPLLSVVTSAVTTPALVIIGVFMLKNVKDIKWDSGYEEVIPAFLIIIFMPFTGSITLGLTIGFVSYYILMLFAGRKNQLSNTMTGITFISILYLIGTLT